MTFDHLGSDLLHQPLLSSQIIPDLNDDDVIISKTVKPTELMQKTIVKSQPNANKVFQQMVQTKVPVQIKTAAAVAMEHNSTAQKVQIVKRIPTNLIHASDAKSTVKQIIGDNVRANTPIVINKLNGNISGN